MCFIFVFLMFNLFVVGEIDDDVIVIWCIVRVVKGGYGVLEVVNLFVLVFIDFQVFYVFGIDLIGFENDQVIIEVVCLCKMFVCVWSIYVCYLGCEVYVFGLFDQFGVVLYVLVINKDGIF